MSQAIAIEALHEAIFNQGHNILFVSRSKEAAQNLLRYVKLMLEDLPQDALTWQFLGDIVVDNTERIEFSNKSQIISVAAAKGTGRTFAASHTYLDEEAWMQWAEYIYQSTAPGTALGGKLTVCSTPNGRAGIGGHFWLLWSGEVGQNFSQHIVHWTQCPAYNPEGWWLEDPIERRRLGERAEWYISTRPNFSSDQWASEFECDFIVSGLAEFRQEDVDRMASGWVGLCAVGEPGHTYINSWDIARRQDYTVGFTFDVTDYPDKPVQVVAFDRWQGMDYPTQQAKIAERHNRFRGYTVIESNGPGDPVVENVDIHALELDGYFMSRPSKRKAIDALRLLVEANQLKASIPQFRRELLTYQFEDKGLIQDCVMAAAVGAIQVAQPKVTGGWVF